MITSKQSLYSSILPNLPFGLRLSTYYPNIREAQLRAYIGLFSELSKSAATNPFSSFNTIASLDETVTNFSSVNQYDNSSLTNSIELSTEYTYERQPNKEWIDMIYHMGTTIVGTTPHEYDLSDLTDTFLETDYKKSFKSIKAITILNTGDGPLPLDFSPAFSFSSFVGNPTTSFVIEPDCVFRHYTIGDEWNVTDSEKLITIGDGSNLDTSYEMVIFGKGDLP